MTWSELIAFLEQEDAKLSSLSSVWVEYIQSKDTIKLTASEKRQNEWAARSAIDAACRHFAENGAWPKMDRDAALQSWDRWRFAVGFALWLDASAPSSQVKSKTEWLEWLLVECWAEWGVWRLHATPSH